MIYLDNAATTKICSQSMDAINEYYENSYFNPSAVYKPAIEVKKQIETARQIIAKAIYAKSENIFFTSGGTESNNLAIQGTVTNKGIGKVICSSCEHPAVYNVFTSLQNKGFDVEFIPCLSNGKVDEQSYLKIIQTGQVGFVSIMHVNNETGGINDIAKLAKLAKQYNKECVFHSDGVQAFAKKKINLSNSDIDLYSMSAHKINGPKGVGALFVKTPHKLKAVTFGGGQEKNMRSGTENSGGIIAFGKATELWLSDGEEILNNFEKFQNLIINGLSDVKDISYNTEVESSSPHVLSLMIGGVKGEILLHMLEDKGICIGKGSACSSKESVSRALKALHVQGDGIIRISFGRYNNEQEINEFIAILKQCIINLRKIMRR